MKKILISILVMGLLLTTSIASVNVVSGRACRIIYVDDDADPDWYDGTHVKTINEGIEVAGDLIFVFSGTYTENVVVDKSITLKGEDKETTVIDGNFVDNTIWVNASSVSIDKFTIINSKVDRFHSGIMVSEFLGYPTESLTDISISNCIISNNDGGIRLRVIDDCKISNCVINNNSGHSIYVICSENVIIENCEIYDNGRYLGGGWYVSGGIQLNANDDGACKNIEISNSQIHNNIGDGISICNRATQNVEIHHNVISENRRGLKIGYRASNIDVHHNFITRNEKHGVEIDGSSSVLLHNNIISETTESSEETSGIYISDCSSGVTVKRNIISSNNDYGILIIRSSGNNVLENNFIENEKDAYFRYYFLDESNTWDRNYWTRPRVLPKSILGLMKTERGWIPWVEFDWHPAKEPYNIIVSIVRVKSASPEKLSLDFLDEMRISKN